MDDGPWTMDHGRWTMDDGPWTMDHGPCRIVAEGSLQLADDSLVNLPTVRNDPRDAAPHLGEALRAARLAHNVTLDVVQARTKLKREFFEGLERNDLSKWPSSPFYRESYLRAYATAVGLDQADVIEEYRREQAASDIADVPAVTARPRQLTPITIPLILALTFAVAYSAARWIAPAPATSSAPASDAAATVAPAPLTPDAVEPVRARVSDVVLAAEPARIQPAEIEGELVITSTPRGAHVTVNDIGRGSTPVRVRFLPAGSYTVRFIRPGHPSVTRRVTISPDQPRAAVSADLIPLRATN